MRARLILLLASVLATDATGLAQNVRKPKGGVVTPRIDGSTTAAFEQSVGALARSLSAQQRVRFETAMQVHRALAADEDALRQELDGAEAKDVLGLYAQLTTRFDRDRDGLLDPRELEAVQQKVAAARIESNDAAAIATLRALASAQEQVRSLALIDVDRDQRGEYAFVAELTGSVKPRGAATKFTPLLAVQHTVQGSRFTRHGFVFQVWLPGRDGVPVPEGVNGGVGTTAPNADHAELAWCAYAWPQEHGKSGSRALFIAADGIVLESTDNDYSGSRAPQPTAAFPTGVKELGMLPGRKRQGDDGATWQPVVGIGAAPR